MPGISGLALYLPPYRVNLEDWCAWNDQPWDKVRKVVGRSFRMRGPEQSVYTLAANAAWRLIEAYDIDPREIGYLALGTESSSDNSAGAVIVKGMLDDALATHALPAMSRECEVPEFKHACLGGVYAMKNALRYLATDGAARKAIVVCSDIAEYERGSSGEPTQGAGAVAMLLEAEPKLLHVDLAGSGSASDYRMVDFRKPFARFRGQPQRADGQMQDLPVFNGRYSTSCYVDATRAAINAMLARRGGGRRADFFHSVDAVFMHRPYHRMPSAGWAMAYLFALADGDDANRAELTEYARGAGIDAEALLAEISGVTPDMRARVAAGESGEDAFPLAGNLMRYLRKTELWQNLVSGKLSLGSEMMRDLGNLYTAALPAWLAAGFTQAHRDTLNLGGQHWLALGYGSGDAAEALPMRVAEGWEDAAARINFTEALGTPVELDADQYAALHDGHPADVKPAPASDEFVVDRIGETDRPDFHDLGIEYYRYVPAAQQAGAAAKKAVG
ncbi:hydroxymethylglutaryl-CoA synthase family protein [Salinisphaera sp. LB1]|uniref:hydroxymethylglutaryl-CoA synthase family protein n=1 Tax=Salinisphaera sp. LB1 TaxID=2183911 RepID=UPI000D707C84|nr:hydroxymethylglutaryl-CoA synthase family protein [Salinisphaera sp. LB1]AWN16361.1 Hydroxymethylglutaryl-CoA synthase [Salinisphaera sp. LB1]